MEFIIDILIWNIWFISAVGLCCIYIQCLITSDILECEEDPCHADAVCEDTEGSYTCECNDGYTGDGWNCTGMYYSVVVYDIFDHFIKLHLDLMY